MKKILVAASLALSLIAAPVPASVDPFTGPAAAVAEMPAKCWKPLYRLTHKKKCRNYAYWKKMVGEAR